MGIRTTLNVINAEQDLLQARTQLASSERDNLSAIFSVLAASGQLTPELLGLKTQRSFVTNNKEKLGPLGRFQSKFEDILKDIQ